MTRSMAPILTASAPGNPPTVSVCIPAYNEGETLLRLVTYLQSFRWGGGKIVEILVDISGSTDSTRELLARRASESPPVVILDSGARDGLVRALNRLIGAASGDILVRMDADVILNERTIVECVSRVQTLGLGIVSPRVVPVVSQEAGPIAIAVRTLYLLHHEISLRIPKTTVVQVFRRMALSIPADSVMEDAALQLELEDRGYQSAYVGEASVGIYGPATLRDFILQRVRTIRAIQWFGRRYTRRPSTADPALVLGALRTDLKAGTISVWDAATFVTLESMCRFAALFYLGSKSAPIGWAPVATTKPAPPTKRAEGAGRSKT